MMNTLTKYTVVMLSATLLAACGDDNDSDRDFEVRISNLTNNQPLSAVAVVTHDDGFTPWSIGAAASSALEVLAEDGDNSDFIGDNLDGEDANGVSGAGVIPPGGSETISITIDDSDQDFMTLVSMFVNTNDAFVGLGAVDISGLEEGDSIALRAPVYDAGTEANSEAAGSIPGPVDGGTGYDPVRDDIADRVSRHAGVVTSDDGLTASVLNESHRFDNPGMSVTITRQ